MEVVPRNGNGIPRPMSSILPGCTGSLGRGINNRGSLNLQYHQNSLSALHIGQSSTIDRRRSSLRVMY